MHSKQRSAPERRGRRPAAEAEETRARLIAAARALFGERGYGDVSTEEIVARAGVTRGALYHHFEDKRGLFREVVEQVEAELVPRVLAAVPPDSGPAEILALGAQAFLDVCLDDEVRRITLLDAPAVLGWDEFHSITERYGHAVLRATIEHAIEVGVLDRLPADELAHLLTGALTQAGVVIARAEDRDAARRDLGAVIARLLEGLRPS